CVLRREQPDRVPHFEWIIDRKVREAICPGCTMEEFTVRMGLDAILTGEMNAMAAVLRGTLQVQGKVVLLTALQRLFPGSEGHIAAPTAGYARRSS
ncbi:MAG: hypothetical protein IH629_03090, partial [Thermoleophilia bacterium]|nr:hypothetical protein [Thermoleophilia bacterium]